MEVYRISRDKYAKALTASGVANRWNYDQEWVIYTACNRALSTLELVVHRSAIQPAFSYQVMVISIPDEPRFITAITEKDLPPNWRNIEAYPQLQKTGSDWYTGNRSLVLKVPSAVLPSEFNYIINTRHPDYKKIRLLRLESFFWDERLL